tara:strand:+ start:24035 stop:24451 length:417 start_codon:yes stop_codon:yes gene_type:complete
MPAASLADAKFLIRDVLLNDSDVSAIVGGRVFGAHLQDPDARTVEYPIVILDLRSGVASTSSVSRATLDLWAYSRKSGGDALRLYDACQKALQQELLRREGIAVAGYVVEQNRPNEGWNDNVRAYYAQGDFTVRTVNR